MFEEPLKRAVGPSERSKWTAAMSGVRVCDFNCELPGELKPNLVPGHYELLFCQSGVLRVEMMQSRCIHVEKHDILLLSDVSQIRSTCFSNGPFQGVLAVIEVQSLKQLSALMGGLELDIERASQMMKAHGGCLCISGKSWNHALFTALAQLPAVDRGRYCALKAVELLYLLCRGSFHQPPIQPNYCDQYQTEIIRKVGDYIHDHLGEDLSIAKLTEQFHISSTGLKTCFHQIYGRPVHQYISACRMERAAQLLTNTSLSVVQIAAEVGYSSASQFGAMFKKHYFCSPAQYRKREKKV